MIKVSLAIRRKIDNKERFICPKCGTYLVFKIKDYILTKVCTKCDYTINR